MPCYLWIRTKMSIFRIFRIGWHRCENVCYVETMRDRCGLCMCTVLILCVNGQWTHQLIAVIHWLCVNGTHIHTHIINTHNTQYNAMHELCMCVVRSQCGSSNSINDGHKPETLLCKSDYSQYAQEPIWLHFPLCYNISYLYHLPNPTTTTTAATQHQHSTFDVYAHANIFNIQVEPFRTVCVVCVCVFVWWNRASQAPMWYVRAKPIVWLPRWNPLITHTALGPTDVITRLFPFFCISCVVLYEHSAHHVMWYVYFAQLPDRAIDPVKFSRMQDQVNREWI